MNYVSFYGGESTGSVAKRNLTPAGTGIIQSQTVQYPQADTVNFKGREEKDFSAGSTLVKTAAAAILIAGGLGYAHKAGWIGKIKNETLKKYTDKVAEPCYNGCHAVKDFSIKYYDKIKNFFTKK